MLNLVFVVVLILESKVFITLNLSPTYRRALLLSFSLVVSSFPFRYPSLGVRINLGIVVFG